MMILSLSEIARAVGGRLVGDGSRQIHGISTDSRKISSEEMFVALRGERFDGHDFIPQLAGKCAAVLSEEEVSGVDAVVVPDTLKALGTLAAHWKRTVAPKITVGVTGSVGKTTTKELIASVLKEKYRTHFTGGNLNNQIGVPITLIRIDHGCEAVVCEMGMNSRGEIQYLADLVRPNLAVITNIGTAHIERLGSREGILEAKMEILSGMEKGSTVILDGDEPLFRGEAVQKALEDFRVIYVGFDSGNDVYPLDIYKAGDHIDFDVISSAEEFRVTVPAIGDHFIKNTLFAAAVGLACSVEPREIQSGIAAYVPSGDRQRIYQKNKIRVIADCYNASPESMKASLSVLGECEGRKVAVLGDMLELGCLTETAHRRVGKLVCESGAELLLTCGEAARFIGLSAVENGFSESAVIHCENSRELALSVRKNLKEGDTVLFKASRKMEFEEIIAACDLTD